MDILSEEASGLVGSIAMIYSANFGEKYAMFEPAHGSAPKYTGMDKVNPTATILSGAWMLEYIGEKSAGKAIFDATDEGSRRGQGRHLRPGRVLGYDRHGAGHSEGAISAKARSNFFRAPKR